MIGYKLFSLRKNGTIGPLFINKRQVIPLDTWLKAEEGHYKKGFTYRPGWHILSAPFAPHLSTKGRVWAKVEIGRVFQRHTRPANQGACGISRSICECWKYRMKTFLNMRRDCNERPILYYLS